MSMARSAAVLVLGAVLVLTSPAAGDVGVDAMPRGGRKMMGAIGEARGVVVRYFAKKRNGRFGGREVGQMEEGDGSVVIAMWRTAGVRSHRHVHGEGVIAAGLVLWWPGGKLGSHQG
ncbi:hypothetical protein EJB05_42785 [Eragrostis curvula]|uniref:Dirigent protein n=1 Tax=Eragrostis curvula TaxID=38414 RepID=A0A5J9TDA6_9POAL|nr:hypothetical protein EJB05_42785 [Eragrostis curvula]